jgi:hypothetical protein
MRDSQTPDQPNTAHVKAVISAGVVGGLSVVVEAGGLKKVEGRFLRISDMGGPGWMMLSGRGRSEYMALKEWYRARSSAELLARFGMGIW